MKYCCQFCATTSETPSACEVCGVFRNDPTPSDKEQSGFSFWGLMLMLSGLGMLMQISALFL
jgi:hypothetical protein